MILILAEATDQPALWLRARLADATGFPVRILTPAQLLCSRSIVHRVDTEGSGFRIETSAGPCFDSDEVRGLVNRIVTVPKAHLARASEPDRRYAEEEVFAFLLGWLGGLDCPVINPASPDCLGGAWPGPVAIRQFAADAGLVCAPVSLCPGAADPPPDAFSPSDQTHFVLDGRVIGPKVPATTRDRLLAFAHLWGTRLLQIHSGGGGEGCRRFGGATAIPDYRLGGRSLVRALVAAFSA